MNAGSTARGTAMKARLSLTSLASAAALAVLLGSPAARAGDPCLDDARERFKEAKDSCQQNFQAAKDACLNRDPLCVEACRSGRDDCRAATGVDAAIAACNATLTAAKQQCRASHPAGSADLDQCIDQAQVVAFQCFLAAVAQAKPALRECRKSFKVCALACGPSVPANPDGVKQCKLDAVQAYADCKAASQDDFHVTMDACLNRDHNCVEQCRADRDTCAQPVLNQLASDVGACNATRDAAIQNCQNLYGDGTPEQAQCIENAQVAAFQCRDQSRENAWAGLNGCGWDFRMCAQACPPAG